MKAKFHRGLSRASRSERMVLVAAERLARENAFGEAYQTRCDELGSVLVDAADLAVRSTVVEWARREGNLFVRISVHHADPRRVRVFSWRCTVPKAAHRAFNIVMTKPCPRKKGDGNTT